MGKRKSFKKCKSKNVKGGTQSIESTQTPIVSNITGYMAKSAENVLAEEAEQPQEMASNVLPKAPVEKSTERVSPPLPPPVPSILPVIPVGVPISQTASLEPSQSVEPLKKGKRKKEIYNVIAKHLKTARNDLDRINNALQAAQSNDNSNENTKQVNYSQTLESKKQFPETKKSETKEQESAELQHAKNAVDKSQKAAELLEVSSIVSHQAHNATMSAEKAAATVANNRRNEESMHATENASQVEKNAKKIEQTSQQAAENAKEQASEQEAVLEAISLQPVVSEPVVSEPAVSQPVASEAVISQPVASQPVTNVESTSAKTLPGFITLKEFTLYDNKEYGYYRGKYAKNTDNVIHEFIINGFYNNSFSITMKNKVDKKIKNGYRQLIHNFYENPESSRESDLYKELERLQKHNTKNKQITLDISLKDAVIKELDNKLLLEKAQSKKDIKTLLTPIIEKLENIIAPMQESSIEFKKTYCSGQNDNILEKSFNHFERIKEISLKRDAKKEFTKEINDKIKVILNISDDREYVCINKNSTFFRNIEKYNFSESGNNLILSLFKETKIDINDRPILEIQGITQKKGSDFNYIDSTSIMDGLNPGKLILSKMILHLFLSIYENKVFDFLNTTKYKEYFLVNTFEKDYNDLKSTYKSVFFDEIRPEYSDRETIQILYIYNNLFHFMELVSQISDIDPTVFKFKGGSDNERTMIHFEFTPDDKKMITRYNDNKNNIDKDTQRHIEEFKAMNQIFQKYNDLDEGEIQFVNLLKNAFDPKIFKTEDDDLLGKEIPYFSIKENTDPIRTEYIFQIPQEMPDKVKVESGVQQSSGTWYSKWISAATDKIKDYFSTPLPLTTENRQVFSIQNKITIQDIEFIKNKLSIILEKFAKNDHTFSMDSSDLNTLNEIVDKLKSKLNKDIQIAVYKFKDIDKPEIPKHTLANKESQESKKMKEAEEKEAQEKKKELCIHQSFIILKLKHTHDMMKICGKILSTHYSHEINNIIPYFDNTSMPKYLINIVEKLRKTHIDYTDFNKIAKQNYNLIQRYKIELNDFNGSINFFEKLYNKYIEECKIPPFIDSEGLAPEPNSDFIKAFKDDIISLHEHVKRAYIHQLENTTTSKNTQTKISKKIANNTQNATSIVLRIEKTIRTILQRKKEKLIESNKEKSKVDENIVQYKNAVSLYKMIRSIEYINSLKLELIEIEKLLKNPDTTTFTYEQKKLSESSIYQKLSKHINYCIENNIENESIKKAILDEIRERKISKFEYQNGDDTLSFEDKFHRNTTETNEDYFYKGYSIEPGVAESNYEAALLIIKDYKEKRSALEAYNKTIDKGLEFKTELEARYDQIYRFKSDIYMNNVDIKKYRIQIQVLKNKISEYETKSPALKTSANIDENVINQQQIDDLTRLIDERTEKNRRNIKKLEEYGEQYVELNDHSDEYYNLESEITLLQSQLNELYSSNHALNKNTLTSEETAQKKQIETNILEKKKLIEKKELELTRILKSKFFNDPIDFMKLLQNLKVLIKKINEISNTNVTGKKHDKLIIVNTKEKDLLTRIISLNVIESYGIFMQHIKSEPGDPYFYYKLLLNSLHMSNNEPEIALCNSTYECIAYIRLGEMFYDETEIDSNIAKMDTAGQTVIGQTHKKDTDTTILCGGNIKREIETNRYRLKRKYSILLSSVKTLFNMGCNNLEPYAYANELSNDCIIFKKTYLKDGSVSSDTIDININDIVKTKPRTIGLFKSNLDKPGTLTSKNVESLWTNTMKMIQYNKYIHYFGAAIALSGAVIYAPACLGGLATYVFANTTIAAISGLFVGKSSFLAVAGGTLSLLGGGLAYSAKTASYVGSAVHQSIISIYNAIKRAIVLTYTTISGQVGKMLLYLKTTSFDVIHRISDEITKSSKITSDSIFSINQHLNVMKGGSQHGGSSSDFKEDKTILANVLTMSQQILDKVQTEIKAGIDEFSRQLKKSSDDIKKFVTDVINEQMELLYAELQTKVVLSVLDFVNNTLEKVSHEEDKFKKLETEIINSVESMTESPEDEGELSVTGEDFGNSFRERILETAGKVADKVEKRVFEEGAKLQQKAAEYGAEKIKEGQTKAKSYYNNIKKYLLGQLNHILKNLDFLTATIKEKINSMISSIQKSLNGYIETFKSIATDKLRQINTFKDQLMEITGQSSSKLLDSYTKLKQVYDTVTYMLNKVIEINISYFMDNLDGIKTFLNKITDKSNTFIRQYIVIIISYIEPVEMDEATDILYKAAMEGIIVARERARATATFGQRAMVSVKNLLTHGTDENFADCLKILAQFIKNKEASILKHAHFFETENVINIMQKLFIEKINFDEFVIAGGSGQSHSIQYNDEDFTNLFKDIDNITTKINENKLNPKDDEYFMEMTDDLNIMKERREASERTETPEKTRGGMNAVKSGVQITSTLLSSGPSTLGTFFSPTDAKQIGEYKIEYLYGGPKVYIKLIKEIEYPQRHLAYRHFKIKYKNKKFLSMVERSDEYFTDFSIKFQEESFKIMFAQGLISNKEYEEESKKLYTKMMLKASKPLLESGGLEAVAGAFVSDSKAQTFAGVVKMASSMRAEHLDTKEQLSREHASQQLDKAMSASDTIRGFSSHMQTAITDLHRTHEMSTKQLELLWNGGTSEQSLALVKKYAALSNERMVADEFGNMIEFNDFKKLTENGTQKKTFMQAFAEKNKEYDAKIKSIVEIKTEVEEFKGLFKQGVDMAKKGLTHIISDSKKNALILKLREALKINGLTPEDIRKINNMIELIDNGENVDTTSLTRKLDTILYNKKEADHELLKRKQEYVNSCINKPIESVNNFDLNNALEEIPEGNEFEYYCDNVKSIFHTSEYDVVRDGKFEQYLRLQGQDTTPDVVVVSKGGYLKQKSYKINKNKRKFKSLKGYKIRGGLNKPETVPESVPESVESVESVESTIKTYNLGKKYNLEIETEANLDAEVENLDPSDSYQYYLKNALYSNTLFEVTNIEIQEIDVKLNMTEIESYRYISKKVLEFRILLQQLGLLNNVYSYKRVVMTILNYNLKKYFYPKLDRAQFNDMEKKIDTFLNFENKDSLSKTSDFPDNFIDLLLKDRVFKKLITDINDIETIYSFNPTKNMSKIIYNISETSDKFITSTMLEKTEEPVHSGGMLETIHTQIGGVKDTDPNYCVNLYNLTLLFMNQSIGCKILSRINYRSELELTTNISLEEMDAIDNKISSNKAKTNRENYNKTYDNKTHDNSAVADEALKKKYSIYASKIIASHLSYKLMKQHTGIRLINMKNSESKLYDVSHEDEREIYDFIDIYNRAMGNENTSNPSYRQFQSDFSSYCIYYASDRYKMSNEVLTFKFGIEDKNVEIKIKIKNFKKFCNKTDWHRKSSYAYKQPDFETLNSSFNDFFMFFDSNHIYNFISSPKFPFVENQVTFDTIGSNASEKYNLWINIWKNPFLKKWKHCTIPDNTRTNLVKQQLIDSCTPLDANITDTEKMSVDHEYNKQQIKCIIMSNIIRLLHSNLTFSQKDRNPEATYTRSSRAATPDDRDFNKLVHNMDIREKYFKTPPTGSSIFELSKTYQTNKSNYNSKIYNKQIKEQTYESRMNYYNEIYQFYKRNYELGHNVDECANQYTDAIKSVRNRMPGVDDAFIDPTSSTPSFLGSGSESIGNDAVPLLFKNTICRNWWCYLFFDKTTLDSKKKELDDYRKRTHTEILTLDTEIKTLSELYIQSKHEYETEFNKYWEDNKDRLCEQDKDTPINNKLSSFTASEITFITKIKSQLNCLIPNFIDELNNQLLQFSEYKSLFELVLSNIQYLYNIEHESWSKYIGSFVFLRKTTNLKKDLSFIKKIVIVLSQLTNYECIIINLINELNYVNDIDYELFHFEQSLDIICSIFNRINKYLCDLTSKAFDTTDKIFENEPGNVADDNANDADEADDDEAESKSENKEAMPPIVVNTDESDESASAVGSDDMSIKTEIIPIEQFKKIMRKLKVKLHNHLLGHSISQEFNDKLKKISAIDFHYLSEKTKKNFDEVLVSNTILGKELYNRIRTIPESNISTKCYQKMAEILRVILTSGIDITENSEAIPKLSCIKESINSFFVNYKDYVITYTNIFYYSHSYFNIIKYNWVNYTLDTCNSSKGDVEYICNRYYINCNYDNDHHSKYILSSSYYKIPHFYFKEKIVNPTNCLTQTESGENKNEFDEKYHNVAGLVNSEKKLQELLGLLDGFDCTQNTCVWPEYTMYLNKDIKCWEKYKIAVFKKQEDMNKYMNNISLHMSNDFVEINQSDFKFYDCYFLPYHFIDESIRMLDMYILSKNKSIYNSQLRQVSVSDGRLISTLQNYKDVNWDEKQYEVRTEYNIHLKTVDGYFYGKYKDGEYRSSFTNFFGKFKGDGTIVGGDGNTYKHYYTHAWNHLHNQRDDQLLASLILSKFIEIYNTVVNKHTNHFFYILEESIDDLKTWNYFNNKSVINNNNLIDFNTYRNKVIVSKEIIPRIQLQKDYSNMMYYRYQKLKGEQISHPMKYLNVSGSTIYHAIIDFVERVEVVIKLSSDPSYYVYQAVSGANEYFNPEEEFSLISGNSEAHSVSMVKFGKNIKTNKFRANVVGGLAAVIAIAVTALSGGTASGGAAAATETAVVAVKGAATAGATVSAGSVSYVILANRLFTIIQHLSGITHDKIMKFIYFIGGTISGIAITTTYLKRFYHAVAAGVLYFAIHSGIEDIEKLIKEIYASYNSKQTNLYEILLLHDWLSKYYVSFKTEIHGEVTKENTNPFFCIVRPEEPHDSSIITFVGEKMDEIQKLMSQYIEQIYGFVLSYVSEGGNKVLGVLGQSFTSSNFYKAIMPLTDNNLLKAGYNLIFNRKQIQEAITKSFWTSATNVGSSIMSFTINSIGMGVKCLFNQFLNYVKSCISSEWMFNKAIATLYVGIKNYNNSPFHVMYENIKACVYQLYDQTVKTMKQNTISYIRETICITEYKEIDISSIKKLPHKRSGYERMRTFLEKYALIEKFECSQTNAANSGCKLIATPNPLNELAKSETVQEKTLRSQKLQLSINNIGLTIENQVPNLKKSIVIELLKPNTLAQDITNELDGLTVDKLYNYYKDVIKYKKGLLNLYSSINNKSGFKIRLYPPENKAVNDYLGIQPKNKSHLQTILENTHNQLNSIFSYETFINAANASQRKTLSDTLTQLGYIQYLNELIVKVGEKLVIMEQSAKKSVIEIKEAIIEESKKTAYTVSNRVCSLLNGDTNDNIILAAFTGVLIVGKQIQEYVSRKISLLFEEFLKFGKKMTVAMYKAFGSLCRCLYSNNIFSITCVIEGGNGDEPLKPLVELDKGEDILEIVMDMITKKDDYDKREAAYIVEKLAMEKKIANSESKREMSIKLCDDPSDQLKDVYTSAHSAIDEHRKYINRLKKLTGGAAPSAPSARGARGGGIVYKLIGGGFYPIILHTLKTISDSVVNVVIEIGKIGITIMKQIVNKFIDVASVVLSSPTIISTVDETKVESNIIPLSQKTKDFIDALSDTRWEQLKFNSEIMITDADISDYTTIQNLSSTYTKCDLFNDIIKRIKYNNNCLKSYMIKCNNLMKLETERGMTGDIIDGENVVVSADSKQLFETHCQLFNDIALTISVIISENEILCMNYNLLNILCDGNFKSYCDIHLFEYLAKKYTIFVAHPFEYFMRRNITKLVGGADQDTYISKIYKTLCTTVKNIIHIASDTIKSVGLRIMNCALEAIDVFVSNVKDISITLYTAAKELVTNAYYVVKSKMTVVVAYVKHKYEIIMPHITSAISTIYAGIKYTAYEVFKMIKSIGGSIVNKIFSFFSTILSVGKTTMDFISNHYINDYIEKQFGTLYIHNLEKMDEDHAYRQAIITIQCIINIALVFVFGESQNFEATFQKHREIKEIPEEMKEFLQHIKSKYAALYKTQLEIDKINPDDIKKKIRYDIFASIRKIVYRTASGQIHVSDVELPNSSEDPANELAVSGDSVKPISVLSIHQSYLLSTNIMDDIINEYNIEDLKDRNSKEKTAYLTKTKAIRDAGVILLYSENDETAPATPATAGAYDVFVYKKQGNLDVDNEYFGSIFEQLERTNEEEYITGLKNQDRVNEIDEIQSKIDALDQPSKIILQTIQREDLVPDLNALDLVSSFASTEAVMLKDKKDFTGMLCSCYQNIKGIYANVMALLNELSKNTLAKEKIKEIIFKIFTQIFKKICIGVASQMVKQISSQIKPEFYKALVKNINTIDYNLGSIWESHNIITNCLTHKSLTYNDYMENEKKKKEIQSSQVSLYQNEVILTESQIQTNIKELNPYWFVDETSDSILLMNYRDNKNLIPNPNILPIYLFLNAVNEYNKIVKTDPNTSQSAPVGESEPLGESAPHAAVAPDRAPESYADKYKNCALYKYYIIVFGKERVIKLYKLLINEIITGKELYIKDIPQANVFTAYRCDDEYEKLDDAIVDVINKKAIKDKSNMEHIINSLEVQKNNYTRLKDKINISHSNIHDSFVACIYDKIKAPENRDKFNEDLTIITETCNNFLIHNYELQYRAIPLFYPTDGIERKLSTLQTQYQSKFKTKYQLDAPAFGKIESHELYQESPIDYVRNKQKLNINKLFDIFSKLYKKISQPNAVLYSELLNCNIEINKNLNTIYEDYEKLSKIRVLKQIYNNKLSFYDTDQIKLMGKPPEEKKTYINRVIDTNTTREIEEYKYRVIDTNTTREIKEYKYTSCNQNFPGKYSAENGRPTPEVNFDPEYFSNSIHFNYDALIERIKIYINVKKHKYVVDNNIDVTKPAYRVINKYFKDQVNEVYRKIISHIIIQIKSEIKISYPNSRDMTETQTDGLVDRIVDLNKSKSLEYIKELLLFENLNENYTPP
jgi:hypothetical protein